ncbi:MAG: hypothetical protein IT301_12400 [Dehalococcoidia bacterium]|nr:hypothetical protein [Dehalococcoidia bacterium]
MTTLDAVVAQALELSPNERAILVLRVQESLAPDLESMLKREAQCADEHPESLLDWEDAEKVIFGRVDLNVA